MPLIKLSINIKRIVIGLISLWLAYYLISSLATAGPTIHHRTEFNSPKLQLIKELEKHSNWKKLGLNFQPNQRASLPVESTLRQQLSYQFPYDPSKPYPKIIWQTWKVPLDSEDFPKRYRRFQETWEENNPNYKHFVLTDDECELMILMLYTTVPDVVKAYKSMPKSILKADFFRYLILFARGGVYSDIDTAGLKPIDEWVSNSPKILDKPNNSGLVVGIEADPDRPDWNEWYARRIQFCQWTIQLKKGHPMLRELIAKITEITLEREKQGNLKQIVGKDEGGDIMNWTGPGIFTDTVFDYMNNILQTPEAFKTRNYEVLVDWKLFTGMQQPIAIDDVLVLPITSFSPDVMQMGSMPSTDPMAYAKHMFLGSWKTDDKAMPEMEVNV